MKLTELRYNTNKPAFGSVFAIKGKCEDNDRIVMAFSEKCNEFISEICRTRKLNLNKISENLSSFDVINLTPTDIDETVCLFSTNENTFDSFKFVEKNKNNYFFDLYDETDRNKCNIDIKAKEYYEKGEIDNFLDCLIAKRKMLAENPMVLAKKIVDDFRKSADVKFRNVPILDAKEVLEAISNKNFDFIKGIICNLKHF